MITAGEPVVYTIPQYLECAKTNQERIDAIEALITSMIASIADVIAGAGGSVSEYWLNDGQISIKTSYRSVDQVTEAVKGLERMKQLYINRLMGRQTVLRDVNSLR